ncbi:PA2169 family four-helix-bundle protein [Mucilaginibacter sp. Bleaf8]|uniref:PA2169 family four-helix-bundle protein n=1 Tax=Mucilaginibacter sp. Bleaf8 TaxID=2834430 RepID=UPI001BCA7F22|nr:PA2169 family four-helix-bundle protein [Mucilaginibacter sp. Bleaf8]MBS7563428.1 PA2169 family four-helix-bundle protein [Mucilaginibacter sp. Bleaf8]
METTQNTVETLNDLIKIHNDRIQGYERAIKETPEEQTELKQLFTSFIGDSHQFKLALATEVQAFARDIENTTSTSGDIHRTWINLKTFFTGHTTKSVLEECEFGEDATQKAYKSALAEEHLPAYIKEILTNQEVNLKAAHDKVKQLRDLAKQES